MIPLSDRIQTVGNALLHSVRAELIVLAAVFAMIAAVTIAFVIREIRNDISSDR